MGKLHELLAVERDLEAGAEKVLNQVLAKFNRGNYVGRIRTYQPLEEGGAAGQVPNLQDQLQEYRTLRGWTADGVPTKEKLDELSLGFAA